MYCSAKNIEDNYAKMVATNSKTRFDLLSPDMQSKRIFASRSERFRQKRKIISLGKQVKKLKQKFKQSTKVFLDGSDGVDFSETNTETPQENSHQSVEQVEESANQHNTFVGETRRVFNEISDNQQNFEGLAREAIVELFEQGVHNQ